MEGYRRVTIIGTSHISPQSVKEVKRVILKQKPKIVALELDNQRFQALMNNNKKRISLKAIRKMGLKGFIFNSIGAWAENRLGKTVSTAPGSEMKSAIQAARTVNARIALIDQDINKTLRKLTSRISWKEKLRFLKEIFKGTVSNKEKQEFDLKGVPTKKIIEQVTEKVKREYPSIYLTLIKERNEYMVKKLIYLTEKVKTGKIIAVVGAGHEKEMIKLLKNTKT